MGCKIFISLNVFPSILPVKEAAKPSGSRSELSAVEPDFVQYKGESTAAPSAHTTLTSSQLLNTSMTSTSSELSLLARRQQVRKWDKVF